MDAFYSQWLQGAAAGQQPLADALQAVQRKFINDEPGFDWTPFVLVGDG